MGPRGLNSLVPPTTGATTSSSPGGSASQGRRQRPASIKRTLRVACSNSFEHVPCLPSDWGGGKGGVARSSSLGRALNASTSRATAHPCARIVASVASLPRVLSIEHGKSATTRALNRRSVRHGLASASNPSTTTAMERPTINATTHCRSTQWAASCGRSAVVKGREGKGRRPHPSSHGRGAGLNSIRSANRRNTGCVGNDWPSSRSTLRDARSASFLS